MESWRPIFLDVLSSTRGAPFAYASLYDGVRLLACAVTASDRGEMGRMVGRMSMGATLEGPLVHVVRFPGGGRVLAADISVEACTGDGRGGVSLAAGGCGGAAGAAAATTTTRGAAVGVAAAVTAAVAATSAFSVRPISDFLNHDGLDEVGVDVAESLEFRPMSDCFRPRILEADDLGRSGSTASAKYSWARACVDVGRLLGSHIRHHVTKWLSDAGHCGGCRMVSMACGAILGKEKPSFPARRTPSRHSPPPTRPPLSLNQTPGLPMISLTLQI